MKTAEERLESLEGDNYFLSEKLRELDDVLVSQQKQIDRLEKALEEAVSAIGRLRASMEELSSGKNAQELEVPPHYGNGKSLGFTRGLRLLQFREAVTVGALESDPEAGRKACGFLQGKSEFLCDGQSAAEERFQFFLAEIEQTRELRFAHLHAIHAAAGEFTGNNN